MTEAEWLACDDPRKMLSYLYRQAGDRCPDDRKLRLFACACLRDAPWTLPLIALQSLDLAERDADAVPPVSRGLRDPVVWECSQQTRSPVQPERIVSPCVAATNMHWSKTNRPESLRSVLFQTQKMGLGRKRQAALLRNIVGNPFGPIEEIGPRRGGLIMLDAWYGGVYHFPEQPALVMARTVYEQRLPDGRLDPVLLSVLADALEDHDLHPDLLEVLRSPGPHYRGLWPVDLILGKE